MLHVREAADLVAKPPCKNIIRAFLDLKIEIQPSTMLKQIMLYLSNSYVNQTKKYQTKRTLLARRGYE